MSPSSAKNRLEIASGSRLFLRVLGGLVLTGSGGPIGGRASQRRRLGLLAILAHARGRPVSRDKLVAVLWPETETERARHALADSIYILRGALGGDVLLSSGDDVSLNVERIPSDIEGFLGALDAGDRASAVETYARGGPFLDGIHLGAGAEFEEWSDSVRSQLADIYRQALESLAREAADHGDRAMAVVRWRQLATVDRLNSRAALELMRALANAGDAAGALDYFRVHERIVRVELDVAPDPSVIAFAAELRAGVGSPRSSRSRAEFIEMPVFEEGSRPPPPSRSPPSAPRRRAGRYTAAFLAVSALLAAGRQLWLGRSPSGPPSTEPSIVVLPLEPADPADVPLADGLTDEFMAMLGKSGRLRVISHTSAFAFKGRHLDVRLIADSLRVSHVLEGTLRRSGSRIRLQMQLVDGRTGTTLWTDVYDRETTDVFALQDEVAQAVARQLDARLAGPVPANLLRHQTRDIVAYELFLRANDPVLLLSQGGVQRSLDYFSRAIAADPGYAAAYAGLAYQYAALGFEGTGGEARRVLYRRAEEAALKAVSLDDSLADAHLALGFARMRLLEFGAADREFGSALALGPTSALIRPTVVFYYGSTGRYASALVAARSAAEDDPLSAVAEAEVARALLMNDRCDEALARLERLTAIRPTLPRAAIIAARCYIKEGRWAEAIARLRSARLDVRQQSLLAYALGRAGQTKQAREILEVLLARWRGFEDDAFEVAVAFAGLGDMEQAFTWLDRSLEDYSLGVESVETALDVIRRDTRWTGLRTRVGLGPQPRLAAQLETSDPGPASELTPPGALAFASRPGPTPTVSTRSARAAWK